MFVPIISESLQTNEHCHKQVAAVLGTRSDLVRDWIIEYDRDRKAGRAEPGKLCDKLIECSEHYRAAKT